MAAVPAQEFVELLAVARGYQQSRALTVAAELGIADLLRDGPVPVDELAVATNTNVEALYRLLRALASIGVFDEQPDRSFGLTPMGEYLRSDHPLTVGPVACMFGAEYEWKAWGALPHAVRTGENAAVQALGVDVWEYRRQHPDDNLVFDAAMRTFSSGDGAALGEAYDFGRHRMIAVISRKVEIINWKVAATSDPYNFQVAVYALAVRATDWLFQLAPGQTYGYVINLLDAEPGLAINDPYKIDNVVLEATINLIYEKIERIEALVQGRKFTQLNIEKFNFARSIGTCALCNWKTMCVEMNNGSPAKFLSDSEFIVTSDLITAHLRSVRFQKG